MRLHSPAAPEKDSLHAARHMLALWHIKQTLESQYQITRWMELWTAGQFIAGFGDIRLRIWKDPRSDKV